MKSAVREIFYGRKLDPKDTKHFKAPFHNASQNLISSLSRLKLESVDHTFFKIQTERPPTRLNTFHQLAI